MATVVAHVVAQVLEQESLIDTDRAPARVPMRGRLDSGRPRLAAAGIADAYPDNTIGCHKQETLARIQHMLMKGKPLRN